MDKDLVSDIFKQLSDFRKNAQEELMVALVAEALQNDGLEQPQDVLFQLAERLLNISGSIDEPRFDVWDYSDAICYTTFNIDIDKLNELDEDDFSEAVIFLAEKTRETYSRDVAPSQNGDQIVSSICMGTDAC